MNQNGITDTNEILYMLSVDYPDVVKKIEIFWGSNYFYEFIINELINKKNSDYDQNIISLLNKLRYNHDEEFPELAPRHKPFTVG